MNICKGCHSCRIPCGREEGKQMDWNSYFIKIAETVAERSKDPNTKVGAIIVNKDKHIVSTGYNGCPAGFPESASIWNKRTKYDYVVHAEMNALLHSTQFTVNCILYTTLSPCGNCAKYICAAGITEVYYKEYREDLITNELFKGCNVLCKKVDL